MKRLIQVFILLLGVSLYSQDTLSVKDGAYGYDKDFTLDLHITTATAIKALQFDIKYDGNNFNYLSQYALNKERLGGDDSDHVITIKEVVSGTVRVLIYSPSNKAIPTGAGKVLSVDFHTGTQYGYFDFNLASVVASKEDNTNLNFAKLEKGVITVLAPSFNWSSKSISFGSIYKGTTADSDFTLKNEGTDTLTVSLEKDELTKFALTDFDTKTNVITWPQKIDPGKEVKINARFDSSENGIFSQKLLLKTNDPKSAADKVEEFVFTAKAYNDNRITVQTSADANNKQTSDVKVSINGDENITSFQFDITASDSKIEFISKSASLLKSGTDHVISSNVLTNSDTGKKFLRVVVYSPSNAVMTQPIGEVVKFSVRPEKIVNPGIYALIISDEVLTNKDLTNVFSESENGSINLITGRLAFPSGIVDKGNRVFTWDLGELFRKSYNEKTIQINNDGNKKLIFTSASSSNPDMSVSATFPFDLNSSDATSLDFKIVPSGTSDDFSGYLKFTHDGGSEVDSVLVTAKIANRNIVVLKNSNVSKATINSVPISMLNSDEIKGMQFDLTLPKETKAFTWTLSADSNEDFNFKEIDNAKDPGISHYVGDEVNFINNAGSTHPLYIVTGLGEDGGYDANKQLAGVTNQGATSGTVKVDLSEVSPGTYYYICGNHKSMQGTITILPKFSITADSSNLVSDRSSDFILTQSVLGARKYRFLIYSNSNSLFSGNSGNIINMPIALASISNSAMDIADGSYQVVIDNLIISGKDNTNVASQSTSSGTIVVGGTNEFDPVVTPDQKTSLKENSKALTYFHKVKATDADDNSFLDDFKIVSGNDDGLFAIVSETGELYVLVEGIDYETKSSYSLGITVSDGTKTSAEEAVVINITDDPNSFVVNNFTVKIFSSSGKVGISNDSDIRTSAVESVFTYKLNSGNDKDLFSINPSTGKLTFNSAPVFSSPSDLNKDNLYEVSIKSIVNDDTSTNIPVISSEKTVSIIENTTDALTVTSMLSTSGSDTDGDGVIDSLDNCPNISNPNQRDFDSNGEGDLCEDSDGDGVLDYKDVCPYIPNADQKDSDFDGIGDVCDDSDGDGTYDAYDNCITTSNPDQADMDSDGIGDVCDDSDGDGIFDSVDNCPTTVNPDQVDIDGDGIGDVCDDDKDGDTILNDSDNCPTTANTDQSDIDGDGIGDVCDDDKDGDGIANASDNCPTVSNADQADSDGDGIGDACKDTDGDGIIDTVDNCPNTANTDQSDIDGDGIGDVCDDDKDGDTILNTVDNCPETANTDQADFDNDGKGDVCDSDIDGDGILNAEDDCPNTPLGSVIDTKGCKIFTLPVDNNKVEITSATCIGTSDGSLGLSIEDNTYDYKVTITGVVSQEAVITGENKTVSITGLAKGDYTVCFKVDGQADYEQCFEVVIGEPKALSAFIDVDNDKRTTSIQLAGSTSYNIDVNGKRHQVKGDNFNTVLPTGLSIIKISTNLECQGVIEREIFISEDIFYYPNPTRGEVDVFVHGQDTGVKMSVFTTKGDLVFTRDQKILDSRKTELDLSGVPAGVYLITLEGPTVRKTFKIVKR
jgi:plastocyanin